MTQDNVTLTVPQRLALRAAQSGSAHAFHWRDQADRWQRLSWADFHARVGRLRRGLAAAGLRHGQRMGLIAPVSLNWELLHHAALSMGVSIVGLDAHDQPSRLARMADDAGVTAFAATDGRVLASVFAQWPARTSLEVKMLVDLGSGDDAWPPISRRHSIDSLMALGAAGAEPPEARADDEAAVIFTSGTTGAPKGIAYSHAQLGLAIEAIGQAFGFVGPAGRLLCWLPLSNLFQRMVNLAAVQNGAATWLLADPRQVMSHVANVAPDVFIGVPRFYEKLVEGLHQRIDGMPAPLRWLARWSWQVGRRRSLAGPAAGQMLRLQHAMADALVLGRMRKVMGTRLRCMVTGSAPMAPAVIGDLEALGWTVLEAYGLSENVMPMSMNRVGDSRTGSVGKPLAGNDIRIGKDDVIQVRGPGLFSGYLGDLSGAPLDQDGFYATGDLGRLDADGYLYLTGRAGDLIKTSTGRRVAPAGVEAMLQTAAGVDQAMVLGAGRKYLLALCTCSQERLATTHAWQALQAELGAALARLGTNDRPAGIMVLTEPFSMADGELTPNLKLRRKEIERRRERQVADLCRQIDAQRPGLDRHPLVVTEARIPDPTPRHN